MKNLSLLSLLLLSLNASANNKAIYGEDSRKDVIFASATERQIADSVAAMIPNWTIHYSQIDSTVSFDNSTLRDYRVCNNERFTNQQAVADCTGFLVSDRLLVTAGHCIKNNECGTEKWVFDYAISRPDQTHVTVDRSSVYSCKRVVSAVHTRFTKKDYAVIELDRVVSDRKPLVLSERKITKGDEVFVIGSPSGVPLKVANGHVRSRRINYFKTDLDTFGGNSGSPVINAKTLEVEGILMRGDKDYQPDVTGICNESVKYAQNSGRGEDVTYIHLLKDLIP